MSLVLPIKRKWYDMILSGVKKEEYREIKPYYTIRFMKKLGFKEINSHTAQAFINEAESYRGDYNHFPAINVTFRNGYSNSSPYFVAKCRLAISEGKTEWGAEQGISYFVLKIDEIIN